jgi:hypothetical protein
MTAGLPIKHAKLSQKPVSNVIINQFTSGPFSVGVPYLCGAAL